MALVVGMTLLVVALAPLLLWLARAKSLATALVAGAASLLLLAGVAAVMRPTAVLEVDVANRPIQVPVEGDVGSTACQACHPNQYASWDASYHSSMTQLPTPETVEAPWDREFTLNVAVPGDRTQTRNYAFFMIGDEFWVRSDQESYFGHPGLPDGRRQMVLVTGSHHEQFYWYSTGDGRKLALLPLAYSIREARWVPTQQLQLIPDSAVHDFPGSWNLICVRCHSTHGSPRLESASKGIVASHEMSRFDTQATEFGIACESCHGAGRSHSAVNRNPMVRYAAHLGDEERDDIVNPSTLDPKRSVDVCGSCHSNHLHGDGSREDLETYHRVGFRFRPGDDLADTRTVFRWADRDRPEMADLLEADPYYFRDRYWPDGMVSTSGREMNAFLESKCFTAGDITCLSCHRLHYDPEDPRPIEEWADDQLDYRMTGNEACLQCHGGYRESLEEHTHHPPASSGSLCYNCHMPNTAYGLLKQSRSHEIDIPSVQTTLESTRPSACNLCHLDRTLRWTAEKLEEWYAMPAPEIDDLDRSFISFSALQALRGDAGLRAMTAWHMGWEPALEVSGSDWMVPILAQLLEDPYAAVRYIAGKSLMARPGYEDLDFDYLNPPAAQERAHREALARWDELSPPSERRTGEAILIDSRGEPNRSRFESYLKRRDDVTVYRQE